MILCARAKHASLFRGKRVFVIPTGRKKKKHPVSSACRSPLHSPGPARSSASSQPSGPRSFSLPNPPRLRPRRTSNFLQFTQRAPRGDGSKQHVQQRREHRCVACLSCAWCPSARSSPTRSPEWRVRERLVQLSGRFGEREGLTCCLQVLLGFSDSKLES